MNKPRSSKEIHSVMDRDDVKAWALPESGSTVRQYYIAQGVVLEQARIVELLYAVANSRTNHSHVEIHVDELIALIKGETNE